MATGDFSGELAPDLVDEEVLSALDLDEEPLGGPRPPQLYEPDDPFGPDNEPTLVGETSVEGGAGFSAEEAAMRIEEEPPGMNYDEDPGYLE
jgi:hypothetical protein